MKKIVRSAIPALVGALMLTGCSAATGSGMTESNTTVHTSEEGKDEQLKIVATIFPEYDWVKKIMGEKADEAQISLLCNNGTDMHSYQPTVEDIIKISECDVLIYTGGESEAWVEDALKNASNKDMIKVSLLDEMGSSAKKEETVEGMQEEDHDEDNTGYDEHVWLSLKNAAFLTDSITEALCKADIENEGVYRTNADSYKSSLNELDSRYSTVTKNATVKTLLFADRFPFRYMTDDYGLDYYAAFPGCSAESEASFETIAFLSKKIDELSLKHVMTIDGGNDSMAGTVIANTGSKDQDILVLNSIQSVTKAEMETGLSYMDIMEDNLKVLEKALN